MGSLVRVWVLASRALRMKALTPVWQARTRPWLECYRRCADPLQLMDPFQKLRLVCAVAGYIPIAAASHLQPRARKVFAQQHTADALEAVSVVTLATSVGALVARFDKSV